MKIEDMQALISEFGQSLELSDLALDETGYCTLAFNEEWLLNLQYDESLQRLSLFSHLCVVVPECRLQVYARLLSANLFWQETDGATLGMDEDTGMAVLALRHDAHGLNLPALEALLETFIANVEYWTGEIQRLQQPDAGAAGGQLATGGMDTSMLRV